MKLTQLLFIGVFSFYAYKSHVSCYTPIFISDVELVERIEKYDDKKFLK